MLIKSKNNTKKATFSFRPDFIATSVTTIDFEYLISLGVSTCFVDLDGTVVSRGTFEVDKQLAHALKNSGLDIKIATNRPRSRSLKELKNDLSASGVIHPQGIFGKPSKKYLRSALKEYGLKPHEVVMIGDRFIQDILGANRSSVYSLLVYKLGSSHGKVDSLLSKFEHRMTIKFEQSYSKID
ncbi:MAG: HAD-IA family hydrolase [Patescibacteria group bacterium]|nr:HAD-IA family hydrolase [Patescibacteria group bacterium]